MNYRTILADYQPIEQGDFMLRYKIENRNYVLYSPVKNEVSCIELFSFIDIAPIQLALLLSYEFKDGNELEEFSFPLSCERERLIAYLFDVEEHEMSLKIKHVSELQGYLMFDLIKADKVRNLFQFDIAKKESCLLFDNPICVASIRENTRSNIIHLCWDPYVFYSIEKGGERNAPAYLFASASPILLGYALQKVEQYFVPEVSDPCIGIHVGNKVYEALAFTSYYVRHIQTDYHVIPYRSNGLIYLELLNWNPIILSKFVSSLNKIALLQIKKDLTDDIDLKNSFTCLSFNRRSFIYFIELKIYVEVFLKRYLEILKLPMLHLLG